MKKQCKEICILLTTIIMLLLAGCTQNPVDGVPEMEHGQSDLENVLSKGTLTIGITDFAPMDYYNEDGEEWTGFDAALAKDFAERLGVTLEFVEIDWNKKIVALEYGIVDCIWNGMTMTKELQETISCSNPYLSNAQVIVLRRSEMGKYQTIDACQHLLFAVESGSMGETLLKERKYRYTAYATQMEALESVRNKKADAAVIDIIMAGYYTDNGQEFDELGFDLSLNDEKICVGFRQESDLTDKVNKFLDASYEDGRIQSLAERYGIENAVLDDTDR